MEFWRSLNNIVLGTRPFFEVYWTQFRRYDAFERRTPTKSEVFTLLDRDFEQIVGQIVSKRVKTLSNRNVAASREMLTSG